MQFNHLKKQKMNLNVLLELNQNKYFEEKILDDLRNLIEKPKKYKFRFFCLFN
jgi:hypothetical protein